MYNKVLCIKHIFCTRMLISIQVSCLKAKYSKYTSILLLLFYRIAKPVEYYRKFLEKDVRPDGRELGEFRRTVLNIGCITTAEGSALVKLGNTTIMCGIKAELAAPKPAEPDRGFIVPNVQLTPLCSPHFRPGPPSEQAQVMSQFIAEVIKNSGCVDCQNLCVVPGKLVWVLHCDLMCLDYDGNVYDTAVLALLAAFRNTRLPHVEEKEEVPEVTMDKTCSLIVSSQPVSSTFSIFDDRILFVDPTVEEEGLATGMVTVVTVGNKLCMVHKPGGSPLKSEQLLTCFDRAFDRSKEVLRLIEETILSVER
ncbi:exosome complex component RRP43-like isoform X1 [Mizuhopecten yessoensis]|uniref:exosome complex component RRP43-like isoform X1 n=1 Tax=Mizuhopecten yessoensis TaxID=6573 RepID=UPI000B459D86|nr:exosome complex component RRP43-like isoform X1 [Mizuhopecten yessoensis]